MGWCGPTLPALRSLPTSYPVFPPSVFLSQRDFWAPQHDSGVVCPLVFLPRGFAPFILLTFILLDILLLLILG